MAEFQSPRRKGLMEYLEYRNRFRPAKVQLAIVAESPPVSGHFFYNPESPRDPLFLALTKQLGVPNASKEEGLCAVQVAGRLLIDATYEPINGITDQKLRNAIIVRDFGRLVADLIDAGSPPIVLVKKNVHKMLYRHLRALRLCVLNTEPIPFPSHGNQHRFAECFTPYARRLIAQDLEAISPNADISAVFNLVNEGSPTDVARNKDKMIGEAVSKEHRRTTGKGTAGAAAMPPSRIDLVRAGTRDRADRP
jgi:hypothetical protein